MRIYEFVEINGSQLFMGSKFEIRDLIIEKEKDGYTYHSYIPKSISTQGQILKIDLIFYKESI